jgi:hypothetical protein
MSLFSATGTPISPFNWPRNTDPSFVNKTSDIYETDIVSDPILVLSHIPSLYATTQVNFNISISGTEEVTVTGAQLISPFPAESNFQFTTVNSSTVRIQGIVDSFIGEFFRLKLTDNSFVTIDTIADEPAEPNTVVEWNRPNLPWSRSINYRFNVSYNQLVEGVLITGQQSQFTVTQYIYWNFDPSLAALNDLVERSQF